MDTPSENTPSQVRPEPTCGGLEVLYGIGIIADQEAAERVRDTETRLHKFQIPQE